MTRFKRWLRNEGIESYASRPSEVPFAGEATVGEEVARRYNRPHAIADERDFSVTLNMGGFTGVGVPWGGTSYEDARDSFLQFMYNHDEFGILPGEPYKFFRSVYVKFNGKHGLLTFRTSWITGFMVST